MKAPRLFEEPVVYLIDTSAWINIDARMDAEDVWLLIISLIRKRRIVAPAEVIGEVKRDSPCKLRLAEFGEALKAGARTDVEYLLRVGEITRENPRMCKPTSLKTPADAWVVALAELNEYTVVVDESLKRRNGKIPGVCEKLGIRYLTLDQFVAVEYEAERKAREAIEGKQPETDPPHPPFV